MANILILLTSAFPYGKAESFLETEVKYYNRFDRVFICPLSPPRDGSRINRLNDNQFDNIEIVDCSIFQTKMDKLHGAFLAVSSKTFWYEVGRLLRFSTDRKDSFKRLISFTVSADASAKRLIANLRNRIHSDDTITVYSYWLHLQAYVGVKLKQSLYSSAYCVSRCHRFDIYEERSENYLPYRRFLLKNLDSLFCISRNGANYILDKYPGLIGDVRISRLGTVGLPRSNYKRDKNTLRVISCSYCVKVKRIHLIIETLAELGKKYNVEWTHYGDGELINELQEKAANDFPKTVTFNFKGHVPNKKMLQEYAVSSYDVFLNVSASEGVPVSIMEALSFGIPVVATDVGGTNEVVRDSYNGFLVPNDFSIDNLCRILEIFINSPDEVLLEFRKNAENFWYTNYNAEKNYPSFVSSLIEKSKNREP